jgi:hypothetical protein
MLHRQAHPPDDLCGVSLRMTNCRVWKFPTQATEHTSESESQSDYGANSGDMLIWLTDGNMRLLFYFLCYYLMNIKAQFAL